ncbi:LPS export ABC transporter permease LptG [Pseudofrancisella aestuarii]|uniref:LPS export ABC transporter permease LptG n=1 Tax=Pseudofrancisella aestuarii TaxID=2670347 RepID=A0ABV9TBR3_9GAMM|nr:LPS export ABC transporter permease LptG [Pseudofrancisella aestuarii]
MTSKIDNYIFRTVLASCLIVTIIFSVLFFIFTYLAGVSNSQESALDVLLDTLFQLPGILYVLMPACAMVGALMGLSLLANNSEIIILRASGLSTFQIARGVIGVGLLATIITIILGGYISPALERQVATGSLYNKNIWLKTPSGFINIKNINTEKGEATGIRKFLVTDSKLDEVRYAEKAVYSSDKTATAYNISKIQFPNKPKQNIDVTKQIKEDFWSDALALSIANIVTIDKNSYLNLNQLFKYTFAPKLNTDDGSIRLKFWQEVFQPISLILLMLISVPLSLGSTRSSSMILKLLFGAFIGFMFFIINQIFGPMALMLRLPPIIGAMAPTIIAAVLLIILFMKAKE